MAEDGATAAAAKFSSLLRPIRDLADNWGIGGWWRGGHRTGMGLSREGQRPPLTARQPKQAFCARRHAHR